MNGESGAPSSSTSKNQEHTMSSLSDHPTVRRFWEKAKATPVKPGSAILDALWLRQLCLDAGADDVGFVDIDRSELGNERADIVRFFQPTKALISFVLRMNREPIRSPARSAANVEFHQTGERVNEVARHIVTALGNRGVRAINPAMGFPMEVDRIGTGKIWIVSHKPVAVAAGLGHYREFYGGFIDWVEQIVESKSARDYRNRISNPESASMWQSLSFGANYKSAYCMAVCPAGEDVIAPFLTDRTEYLKDVVRPL